MYRVFFFSCPSFWSLNYPCTTTAIYALFDLYRCLHISHFRLCRPQTAALPLPSATFLLQCYLSNISVGRGSVSIIGDPTRAKHHESRLADDGSTVHFPAGPAGNLAIHSPHSFVPWTLNLKLNCCKIYIFPPQLACFFIHTRISLLFEPACLGLRFFCVALLCSLLVHSK
ncbi:hypothetical protein F4821DRAFT_211579 [Hypoxylon rubiginosum]|uniref:Uncharacterized protein n=1 Tax=Hypoxylon rubiginosum TaxID=110542 RepID=A0ACC0DEU1_9PEZI|nr:hypothetical protein F4821DRAFT_211579 [Hypoxylon rubiginosum]